MFSAFHSRYLGAIAVAMLVMVLPGPAQDYTSSEFVFHSVVPLGVEAIVLQPAKTRIALLATAECPGLEGVRRVFWQPQDTGDGGVGGKVFAKDGKQMTYYPRKISFRVTATAREKLIELEPFDVNSTMGLNQYLLGLTFKLRAYHGINARDLTATKVQLLGPPAKVPYDARSYRVAFNLDKVSIEDRLVLELWSPDGQRLAKFHLELL
jgi:hypothetical protein